MISQSKHSEINLFEANLEEVDEHQMANEKII
jgi:hypothetical protein